jgi:hypothetical protein
VPQLSLELERGYPESFQYFKWCAIVIVLLAAAARAGARPYAAWALVFAYLMFDDSLQIHESVGRYVAANAGFAPAFGLRVDDYGELLASVIAALVLLLPLSLAYRGGSEAFRRSSHDLALLILLLVFFGIVIDMAHVTLRLGWQITFLLAVAEDGGEMLTASLILWYAALQLRERPANSCRLCDLLRRVLPTRTG